MNKTNEFLWPVRVYIEDVDVGGVVFYANYLRYMERARTELLRKWNLNKLGEEDDAIFVVCSVSIKYAAPARLDDLIDVSVSIKDYGRTFIDFKQEVIRDNQRLVTAELKLAYLDKDKFKLKVMPKPMQLELDKLFR